jgi:hypothetical protein
MTPLLHTGNPPLYNLRQTIRILGHIPLFADTFRMRSLTRKDLRRTLLLIIANFLQVVLCAACDWTTCNDV